MQISTPEVRLWTPRPRSTVHTDRPWSLRGELSHVVLQLTWGVLNFFPVLIQRAPRDLSMFTYDTKFP